MSRRGGARDRKGSTGAHRSPGSHETPLVEWWAAGISGVLVLAAIAFMGWQAISHRNGLPDLSIARDTIADVSGGYLVRITARNTGGATAAGLTVQGTLLEGGTVEEQVTTTLDYVPAGSSRQAGLFFAHDPREGRLLLRPLGYQEP